MWYTFFLSCTQGESSARAFLWQLKLVNPWGNTQPEWNWASQALTFSNVSSLIKKAWCWEVERIVLFARKTILAVSPGRGVFSHISTSDRISWTKSSACKIIEIYGYKQRQKKVKDIILKYIVLHIQNEVWHPVICSEQSLSPPRLSKQPNPVNVLLLKTQQRTTATHYFHQWVTSALWWHTFKPPWDMQERMLVIDC